MSVHPLPSRGEMKSGYKTPAFWCVCVGGGGGWAWGTRSFTSARGGGGVNRAVGFGGGSRKKAQLTKSVVPLENGNAIAHPPLRGSQFCSPAYPIGFLPLFGDSQDRTEREPGGRGSAAGGAWVLGVGVVGGGGGACGNNDPEVAEALWPQVA